MYSFKSVTASTVTARSSRDELDISEMLYKDVPHDEGGEYRTTNVPQGVLKDFESSGFVERCKESWQRGDLSGIFPMDNNST